MAFSSNFFLFCFLPIVLSVYWIIGPRWRNLWLLIASLSFYAFDAGWTAWVLLASVLVNHLLAHRIAVKRGGIRKALLAAGIVANFAPLFYYKYAVFFWGVANSAVAMVGGQLGPIAPIALPIGISFFTFQAISYLVDVFERRVEPAARLVDFGAYHSLFPQLIAGPIVRYVEIAQPLHSRRLSIDQTADGVYRFCLGLGKKLILADNLGAIVDPIFRLPDNELSTAIAWLGVVAYSLQIYFDFSGYSDMAIGLGKILGFDFPENFNCPYRARSVTEFWRRWHMTLTRWFRDYLYIPLGGNRHGRARTYANLGIVFLLCGLWHGAGYTFIVWGLWHGALLVIERVTGAFQHPRGILGWSSTLLLVAVGWVFFRAADMHQAGHFLMTMFGLTAPDVVYYGFLYFLPLQKAFFLACGLFLALAPLENVSMRLSMQGWKAGLQGTAALVVFFYAVTMLAANSFNPFIYFRF